MEIYLCRHGETDWTLSGQHTGMTDIALNEQGVHQARLLGARLKKMVWNKVFCSPMKRALETCRESGLKPVIEPGASEWNYGQYEGWTSAEIATENPNWNLFRDGAPGGESLKEIENRADTLLCKLSGEKGNVLLFSHGHFSRVLAARWLALPASDGRFFTSFVASLSCLGFEHSNPVIRLWNDTSHL